MSDHHEDEDPNEQARMESEGEARDEHFGEVEQVAEQGFVGVETISLTQAVLGLRPYVLIESKVVEPDGPDDDGLRIAMTAGGGAEEAPASMALLFVTSVAAEDNPLTRAVKEMLEAYPAAEALAESLGAFAEYVGFPMPELEK